MRAMAEPDGTVEVEGTVAVRGSVAKQDPDIDTLADKVSPANNVRRLKDRLAEQAARPDVQLAAAAVGLAVLGYTIYRVWGRRKQ
jgi:hypothetical protein